MGMPTGKPGGGNGKRSDEICGRVTPSWASCPLADLIGPPLVTEISRSMTRARVQQFQRYFNDADRVLILLHNDPDPDAMASGLALRNLLRRTKATAIIGAFQGVTRPENLRMVNLLDIHVEPISAGDLPVLRPDRDGGRPAPLLRAGSSTRWISSSTTTRPSPATAPCSGTSARTTARPAPS